MPSLWYFVRAALVNEYSPAILTSTSLFSSLMWMQQGFPRPPVQGRVRRKMIAAECPALSLASLILRMSTRWAGFRGLSHTSSYSKSCPPSPTTHTNILPRHGMESKGLGQGWHVEQKVERPREPPLVLEASTCRQHLPSVAEVRSLQGRGPANLPAWLTLFTPLTCLIKVINCSWLPRLTVPPEPLFSVPNARWPQKALTSGPPVLQRAPPSVSWLPAPLLGTHYFSSQCFTETHGYLGFLLIF